MSKFQREIYELIKKNDFERLALFQKEPRLKTYEYLSHLCGVQFFKQQDDEFLEFNSVLGCHVISLKNSSRLFNFMSRMHLDIPISLFEGIDARLSNFNYLDFPDLNGLPLRKGCEGHVGCTLSHFNLWRKLLDHEKKYHLILEDDAYFTIYAEHALKTILTELPNDADLIYINDRAVEKIYSQAKFENNQWSNLPDKMFYSRQDMLSIMAENYSNLRKGVHKQGLEPQQILVNGTDGYILTKRGIKKLVTYINRYGFRTKTNSVEDNVDVLLGNLSLCVNDLHERPALIYNANQYIKRGEIPLQEPYLKAYVTRFPVVDCVDRIGMSEGSEIASKYLDPSEINLLRDIAIDIEQGHLEHAKNLMQLAYKLRPRGTFIKKKLNEFIAKLKSNNP